MSKTLLNKVNLAEQDYEIKEVKEWFKESINSNYPNKVTGEEVYLNNVDNLFEGILSIMKNDKIINSIFRFISHKESDGRENIFITYTIGNIPFITRVHGYNGINLREKGKNVDSILQFIKSSIIDNFLMFKFFYDCNFNYHKRLNRIVENSSSYTLFDNIADINKDLIKSAYEELKVENLGNYLRLHTEEELIEKAYEPINYFDLLIDASIEVKNKRGEVVSVIERNKIFNDRTFSRVFSFSQRSDYYFASDHLFNVPKINDIKADTRFDMYLCVGERKCKIENKDKNILSKENLSFHPFRNRFISTSFVHPVKENFVYDLFLDFIGINNIDTSVKRFTYEMLQGVYNGIYAKGNINEIVSNSYILNSENRAGKTKKSRNDYTLLMNIEETSFTSTSIVGQVLFNNMIYKYVNEKGKFHEFSTIDMLKSITFSDSNKEFRNEIKGIYSARKDTNKSIQTSTTRYSNLKLNLELSLRDLFNNQSEENLFMDKFEYIIEGEKHMKTSAVDKFNKKYGYIENEQKLKEAQKEIKEESKPKWLEGTNLNFQVIKESKFTKDVSFKYAGSIHRIDKIRKGDIDLEIAKRKLFINKLINDNKEFSFVENVEFSDSKTIKVTNTEGEVQFVSDYTDILEGNETLDSIKIQKVNKNLENDSDLVKLITGEEVNLLDIDEETLDSFMI